MRIDNRILLPFVASMVIAAFVVFMGWMLGSTLEESRVSAAFFSGLVCFFGMVVSISLFSSKINIGSTRIWPGGSTQ